MNGAIQGLEWSKEDDQKIVELRRKIIALEEIAKQVNRSKIGVVYRLRKLLSTEERKQIILSERRNNRSKDWDNVEVRKQYDNDWYLKNKETVIARSRNFRKQQVLKYEEYKKQQKCQECGKADHRVIVFHHVGKKESEISNLIFKVSWEKVLKELEQCIPLCSYCHTILHYEERRKNNIG